MRVHMRRASIAVLLLFLCNVLAVYAVRETKFYDILGVATDADERTIQKAYRRQAMKYHPDRNPDDKEGAEKKFREVAAAYEVLSDPEKRRIYDQMGEDAALGNGPQGGPGGGGAQFHFQGDPFATFQTVFGGGGFPGGGQRMQFHFTSGSGGGFPGGGGGHQFGGGPRGGRQRQRPGSGLYDMEPAVRKLNTDSFPQSGDGWLWLIEFYAPWCGHCRQLAPKWMKLAKALKGIVKIGAVNCEADPGLCQDHGVQGYPTIISLRPGGSPVVYQGERSAAALRDYAINLLPRNIPTLSTKADLIKFLEQRPSPEWGASLLLFTTKAGPGMLARSLALRFEGKVAVAEVSNAKSSELYTLLGVQKAPAAVMVCGADPGSNVAHGGELKSDALAAFMSGFRDGSKCAAAIKLTPETDLSKFKVKQLKQLLASKGLACPQCIEKSDYLRRVREAYGLVETS